MQKKHNYYIYEMNLKVLTIVSIVLFIFALIPCIWIDFEITYASYLLLMILMIPWLILHELLHSISYVLCGAKFKFVTYGMSLEKGILYCLCKQNISKKNILISLMSPFVIIGVGTYIVGALLKSPVLILLSILNISGCSGDIMMFLFISKLKNMEFSEFNNPVAFGIYTEENLDDKKPFGLNLIDKKELLERSDLKKVQISKASIWILLGLFLVFLLSSIVNGI